ncbi:MAG: hypothetical protein L3K02_05470 [Thermoplasmata archaeon]|nr:hypothetical protein [Thermoplasmata archaeon]
MSTDSFLQSWSHGGQYPYPDVHGTCVGKWPAGGQSFYTNSCIGHDEPAINPFSDLPGSGGNVSWNVSLPVDGGASHNQSDVYIAIWFGMNLYDPYGYDGQCFLELQMYPDTNAAGGVQVGVWSAFAVAWQIQLSNGFEDPCFAAPLVAPGGGPFQMNAGDHLYVNMTGWQGSPLGEKITVIDTTLGVRSHLRLYNHQLNYPLNPAYLANNIDDSLPWSPGGDLPISFAFESGHTTDDPENDTFGGCNSGLPPPNPLNGAVPCGSYNPRDWAMDTAVPWHFYAVTFFNSGSRQTVAQYGFEQDFGASAWIDGLSYGNCTGRDGSAYCSYPWYSYDASLGAFEFGSTDYTGTSQDFGTYSEYASVLQTDSGGLNYYPVQNFTVRTFPGDSLTVGVQGPGTVYFLSDHLGQTSTLDHLPSGAYSVNSVPSTGSYFEGYTTSGAISLDAGHTAWNSFQLSGSGHLTAVFGSTPPAAASITFHDSGGHGFVTAVAGFAFALSALYPPAAPGYGLAPVFQSSATNVGPGGTLSLLPGIYSLQANPKPGYNFTGWTSSSGTYVFTPSTNYTWVNVTSLIGTVTANYEPTPLKAEIWLTAYPTQAGSIRFGSTVYSSGAIFSTRQGTYPVTAIPAPGFTFLTWAPGFVSTMSNWSQSSDVLVQYGSDYLTAVFSAAPVLTAGSAVGGATALNGVLLSTQTLPQVGNLNYSLEAEAHPGYAFSQWAVSNTAKGWVGNPLGPITTIQVNGSVTVTPTFVASTAVASVSFSSHGGRTIFNIGSRISGSATIMVTPGTYALSEVANPGSTFRGWTTSGGASVTTTYTLTENTHADIENLAGTWVATYSMAVTGAGSVTALFRDTTVPVTFIDFPFDSHLSVTVSGGGSSWTIPAGDTAHLPLGSYVLSLSGGSLSGLRWFANSNLTFQPDRGNPTHLQVLGSGTIYAVGEPHGGGGGGVPTGSGSPATAHPSSVIPSSADLVLVRWN